MTAFGFTSCACTHFSYDGAHCLIIHTEEVPIKTEVGTAKMAAAHYR